MQGITQIDKTIVENHIEQEVNQSDSGKVKSTTVTSKAIVSQSKTVKSAKLEAFGSKNQITS
jgi:hypothetical protein